ncbi:hypothetical protein [Pandoraea aquatica]|nr:hypothetical protein [Pandoraea aquatica]
MLRRFRLVSPLHGSGARMPLAQTSDRHWARMKSDTVTGRGEASD